MTPDPLGAGLGGALRALGWAVRFYASHGWPLLAMAALPAVVRIWTAMRGRQMLPAGSDSVVDGLVAAWRGVLMFAIAGLDLLPASPWWDSIWPGAWAAPLSGRLGTMAGHGAEWLWLCAGVAVIVAGIAGGLRALTEPRLLMRTLALAGVPPQAASWRAAVVGFTVGNLVTIPLTLLMIYAAVARAALCMAL